MILLKDLSTLMELTVLSAMLRYERNPVSLLLVASPESGKTELVSRYGYTKVTQIVTDLTAFGLVTKVLAPLSKIPAAQPAKRLIVIPDLVNTLSRNGATVASLISTFQAYIEEGIIEIQTARIQVKFKAPVCGGLITCIVPSEFADRRRSWNKHGFLSRFLVCTYSLDQDTIRLIRDQIWAASDTTEPLDFSLPDESQLVVANRRHLHFLDTIADKYLQEFEQQSDAYGFRINKHVRRLCYAAALRRGATVVGRQDIELVEHLISRYCNRNYNPGR